MEKITLKPSPQELLFKTEEPNTHMDVFTYTGANTQEKLLGSLFLVGHVKYEEEDLGYVISLVSSLAKREYYSEAALKTQDPKKAFEGTLRKLNEVLEDFFKNKNFSLNIGLAAIAGEHIFLSKLGKFKVGLARNGEYIDVLNNVALFEKSPEPEQQFSNVISGKLFPGDKLFAYYPARPMTLRERSLQGVLLSNSQDQFTEKMAQLASTVDNFSCCGVHIAIEQIKEIPLQVTLATQQEEPIPMPLPAPEPAPKPKVVAAELSVSKKANVFSRLADATSRLPRLNRLPIHTKFRGFIIIAAIVLIPTLTIAIIKASGSPREVTVAYNNATESLKLAQSKMAQNDTKEARNLLRAGLAQIGAINDKKLTDVKAQLNASLDSIDHVSSAVPAPAGPLSSAQIELAKTSRMLSTDVWFNGAEQLVVHGKVYKLKDPATANDATLYENNLYILSGNHIYKYADALTGGTKRTDWGITDATLKSIAVDGNLLGLTEDGKIQLYFKGQKKSEIDPGLAVADGMRLLTTKDSPVLYLADPVAHRLYALDKTSGALTATYKLDAVGEIKDSTITLSNDGTVTVWLLSSDLKFWKLTP